MLNGIKARAKARARARAQAADSTATNERLVTELPLHDLMDDVRFHHTLSSLAHSPATAAEADELACAFELVAIAEKVAESTTTAIAVAVPKNKLAQNLQNSPFLKLPPELRCFIYEQVFLDIIEGAEAVSFTRQLAGRDYQSAFIREQINALPHTCRIFRKECAPIYEELSYSANDSRINDMEDVLLKENEPPTSGSPWDRSQELEDLNDWQISAHGIGTPYYESQVTTAVCRMRAVGDIHNVVIRIAENIETQENRRGMAVATKQWEICIGVNDRLHDGAGVRDAFEDEVMSIAGVELTHDEIAIMLRCYASWFSVLELLRMPENRVRAPRSGRVLKISRPYQ